MPVDFAHGGFMPGMRGLQDGVNRNKRVAFLTGDNSTRQLLPNVKTLLGAIHMTAINMGATARHPSALLPPARPAPVGRTPKHPPQSAKLVYTRTRTGLTVLRKGTPVAWIVPGYHAGQAANQPKTCTFVDVAYHLQTPHGIRLETLDCATVPEAKAALLAIFGGEV